jgi:hypothetical protein
MTEGYRNADDLPVGLSDRVREQIKSIQERGADE